MDTLQQDIRDLFENNIEKLAKSLGQALQIALVQYDKLSQSEPGDLTSKTSEVSELNSLASTTHVHKGKLSNVYISFLLSSVLCELPWLRIDLYDENDIFDTIECFSDWDVNPISENLYRSADLLVLQQYEKENIRIEDHEKERIWLNLSGEYYKGFGHYMMHILNKCDIAYTINCRWHYGHLFGKTVVIREPEYSGE